MCLYTCMYVHIHIERKGGRKRDRERPGTKKPTSEHCVILGSFIFLFMLFYILQIPKRLAGRAGMAQKAPGGKRCLKVTNAVVCEVDLDIEMLSRKGLHVSRPWSGSSTPRLLRGGWGSTERE